MRIGVDIRELERGKRTGIGRFLLTVLGSPVLRSSRHEWILMGNQRTVAPGGFPFVQVTERSRLIWDQCLLPSVLRRHAIQVLFSPYRKAPLWRSCPYVVTIHDLFPFSLTGHRSIRELAFWTFMRLVAKRAARIITVSQFVKQEIVERLQVPPDKITVIYHGLDPSFCPVNPDQANERVARTFGIEGGYILFVGQLKPHKNVDKLITAYASLPGSLRRRYTLLIVGGDGSYRTTLEQLIVQRGVSDSVRLLGAVEDTLLPALYSQAAVCALPSRHEGFGLPALEAMACGCPVIAARCTALPEVVGDAGLFVDPDEPHELANVLEDVLSDESLRTELRTRGFERARLFSRDEAVGRLLEVFDAMEQERA